MKKSLLALAALTAFAGAASAQSSVTLFGIVDAGFARVSAGGVSNTGMTNSGLNSSRLGFRGVEDLGGGLRAAFWLEGQLDNDNGNAAGLNFQRRSTVSLIGGFGEVRLGRDFAPHFLNLTVYDPFGTNGIGTVNSAGMMSATGTAGGPLNPAGVNASAASAGVNAVRTNNGFHYFTPTMGGFVGHVHWASGEQPTNPGKGQADMFGFRVGYAAGPISAHYAYGNSKGSTGAYNIKYNNLGASYNLGFVRPMFQWATEKAGTGAKVRAYLIGAVAPMGQGELRASYSDYDVTGTGVSANDWNKMAIGYGYNLSKRTQLYGTYARVSNDGAQTRDVRNNGLSASPRATGGASPGGSSTGYELGIRHSF